MESGDDRERGGETADASRDRLLLEHLPLVHHVVRQVLRRRALDLEEGDLVSAGTVGLMEALQNFDPSRGLAVSTFATPRIRGAVLDELRRRDPLSRGARRRHREIGETRERMSQELMRTPGAGEVARRMGVASEAFWAWERESWGAETVSLDAPVRGEGDEGATSGDVVADESEVSADERLEREDRVKILRDELLVLPSRDRLVLSLYYFEELKLHQIAALLGVSESRVSQIRSSALKVLRGRLRKRMEEGS